MRRNCAEFGIRLYPMGDANQGIVHVIGPQLGITQPGMTIVCGDSHTSTHGAFGALAFGIGTSQVEHVLATQTLPHAATEDDGRDGRRALAGGSHAEGRDPRRDREDRNRWWPGIHGRVPGQHVRADEHGRADDGVQHEHRVGARAGMVAPDRDDIRLSPRA